LDLEAFTTRSSYDALGRAIEVVAPSGQRLAPEYDRSGALRAVTVDDTPYVKLIARNARGQRVLIAYGNGTMTRYAYDPDMFRLHRLRTDHAAVADDMWTGTGAPLQNNDYGYDPVGNCTDLTERTPDCGVSASRAGRDALVRAFTYDGFYRLVSATGRACAAIAEARPLDDLPRCGAVGAAYTGGPASPSQANAPDITTTYVERYRYDEAGNLLDLAYRATSGPVTATWHRLFGISGMDPGDSAGARDNRLTGVRNPGGSPIELHRDEAGNLTGEGNSRTYRWDHAGRLIEFTVQNGTGVSVRARYLYGSDGMRVKKWVRSGDVATNDESRVYLGGLAERHRWAAGGGGQSDLLHVLDGSTLVATVHTGDSHPDDLGPPIRYELGDHLRSISLTVDDTGVWTNREEYFPYGETSFGSFARKRYRFNGMERDEESGLAYHAARYYAPALTRWVSVDPAGPVDTLNRYLAFRANPLTYVDPSGRDSASGGTILNNTPAASPAPLTASPVAGFTGEPQAPTAGLAGDAGTGSGDAGTGSPVTGDRGGRGPAPSASTTRAERRRDVCYEYDLPLLPPLASLLTITPEDEQRVARENGPRLYAATSPSPMDDPFLRRMEQTGQFKAINTVLVPVLAAPIVADTAAYLTTKQAVTAGLTSVTFNLVNQVSHHGTDWDNYNLRSLPVDYVFGAFSNGFVRHTLGVYPAFSRNILTGSLTFSVENFVSQQITIFSYMYISGAARADILGADRSSNVKASLISTTGGAAQSLLLQWFLASKTGVTLFPEAMADPRVMMANSLVGMLRGTVVASIYDVNAPAKQPPK
jgi:RHS repeat-associated protein